MIASFQFTISNLQLAIKESHSGDSFNVSATEASL